MIVRVNGREYKVRLKAAAWPYLRTLSNAFADTKIADEELEAAEKKVLSLCVVGDVHEEDADELLVKILAEFARLVGTEFRSFRQTIS